MRSVCVAWALFSASLFVARAQEWTVYDMGNSPLPSTTVRSLAADGAGGIWVGTDWGLCHFSEGAEWVVYQEGTSPLLENDVRSLAVDAAGRLWIGTASMGLQMKDGDDWIAYTPSNSDIPGFGIRDLFVDGEQRVWVCTSEGLGRFDGTEWVVYDNSENSHDGAVLSTSNTNAVAVRADGTICLGTFNGGLHFIQGSAVDVLTSFDDGFFDNTAVAVGFHPSTGARWIATPAAGLLRQQGPVLGGLWTQWNGATGFPSNSTTSLAFDSAGDVWTGTQISGLVRVRADGSYVRYTQSNSGLPDDNVRSLLATPDGAVWVGMFLGGLARYAPSVGMAEHSPNTVQVYPNPAKGHLTVVRPNGSGPATWRMFAMDGTLVGTGSMAAQGTRLQVAHLNSGAFVLEVRAGALVDRVRVLVD